MLVLGFLLGMRHAVEADHIAAIAALASRRQSSRRALFQGAAWGLGHTTTLFLACSLVLFLDTAVPERLAHGLEALVGAMLLLLGLDLLRRLLRDRVHFHVHSHDDGVVHLHAHSHATAHGSHAQQHHHDHRGFPLRALCVGLIHGMAGSAALILLALGSVATPLTGLLYVALFGLGSIAGMAVLSVAVSLPLQGARRFSGLYNGLQAGVVLATLAIGANLVYENFSLLSMP